MATRFLVNTSFLATSRERAFTLSRLAQRWALARYQLAEWSLRPLRSFSTRKTARLPHRLLIAGRAGDSAGRDPRERNCPSSPPSSRFLRYPQRLWFFLRDAVPAFPFLFSGSTRPTADYPTRADSAPAIFE